MEQVIKIVSGDPADVQNTVNEALETHTPQVWSISDKGAPVIVTCIMISTKYLQRKAFEANAITGARSAPRLV